mmetsp:Transcript_18683/g.57566  ORF Transcript_18683/g.57566 Transcript_18683/m.57566 type:complete len:234 (+) Transcript_18683:1358-2059(+)
MRARAVPARIRRALPRVHAGRRATPAHRVRAPHARRRTRKSSLVARRPKEAHVSRPRERPVLPARRRPLPNRRDGRRRQRVPQRRRRREGVRGRGHGRGPRVSEARPRRGGRPAPPGLRGHARPEPLRGQGRFDQRAVSGALREAARLFADRFRGGVRRGAPRAPRRAAARRNGPGLRRGAAAGLCVRDVHGRLGRRDVPVPRRAFLDQSRVLLGRRRRRGGAAARRALLRGP